MCLFGIFNSSTKKLKSRIKDLETKYGEMLSVIKDVEIGKLSSENERLKCDYRELEKKYLEQHEELSSTHHTFDKLSKGGVLWSRSNDQGLVKILGLLRAKDLHMVLRLVPHVSFSHVLVHLHHLIFVKTPPNVVFQMIVLLNISLKKLTEILKKET